MRSLCMVLSMVASSQPNAPCSRNAGNLTMASSAQPLHGAPYGCLITTKRTYAHWPSILHCAHSGGTQISTVALRPVDWLPSYSSTASSRQQLPQVSAASAERPHLQLPVLKPFVWLPPAASDKAGSSETSCVAAFSFLIKRTSSVSCQQILLHQLRGLICLQLL
jgi:hypothetical protein